MWATRGGTRAFSSMQHVSSDADGALGDDSLRLLIDAGDLAIVVSLAHCLAARRRQDDCGLLLKLLLLLFLCAALISRATGAMGGLLRWIRPTWIHRRSGEPSSGRASMAASWWRGTS